jgi:hypothetical protein
MVAYAGFESTLNVFRYGDLMLRYRWVKFRGWFIGRKLAKELNIPREKRQPFTSIFKD